MPRLLRSLLFLVTVIPPVLRPQLFDIPNRVRPGLRFLLAFVCRALAVAFASVFLALPTGWFDAVMAHLFTVPGAFVASMLLAFGVGSFGMGILSAKVARTL